MEKKFQIFISSTYEDLKEERAKLVATILKDYHFPIGMEMFSADNVEQWEQIRRTIDSSDYYVLVIKRRYGSMTKDGISYTEKEYNYAKEKKIPVLAFVAARDAAITNSDIEDDPEKLFLLKKFTERVLVENPSEFWKNPDDLCTKVSQALHKQFETNQRRGWIKNNEVGGNDDIEKMNIQTLIDIKRKVEYEIIRKNKDIRLAYDFVDNIDDKILHSITKQTYIDNFNREIVLEIIGDQLEETGVTMHLRLSKIAAVEDRPQFVEKIGSYTVLTTSLNYASPKQLLFKRVMDIAGGLVGCLLTVIIFIFVAPVIYISSPGPIFFSQERIGKNGKKFKIYKFRSMYMDAEARKAELMKQNRVADGKMFKLDFDPRVIGNKILPDGTKKTGVGNFIRVTSLDEFPQFFNVLKGDMSLVGTRPPLPGEVSEYEIHHRARLAIKPGITGMWQVSGRSDITDFEEVVRLDTKYIKEWTPALDIKILFKTVKTVLGKEGSM